jgi:hypothetical protein
MKLISALLALCLLFVAIPLPAQEDNRRTLTRSVTLDTSVFAVAEELLFLATNTGYVLPVDREHPVVTIPLRAPVEKAAIRFMAGERGGPK